MALVPIGQQLMPIMGQMARLGAKAVKARRRRRVRANKWVLGSRLLGYQFNPNSTPRGRRRSRRGRPATSGLDTRGVQTTYSMPVNYGHTVRRVTAPINRVETGNEELGTIQNGPVDGAFNSASWSINPAECSTFTRLSVLATQYQRYNFRELQISFTPFKGTSQTGEIAITMAPDPTHPVPSNMTEFMGLFGAVRGPVNLPLTYCIPAALFSKALNQYMMAAPLTPNPADDSVINSVGRVYAAVQNCTGGANLQLGRVAISYSLVLNDPMVNPVGASDSGSIDFDATVALTPWDQNDVLQYNDSARNVRALWWDDTKQLWHQRSRSSAALIVRAEYVGAGGAATITDFSTNPAGVNIPASVVYNCPVGVNTITIEQFNLPFGNSMISIAYSVNVIAARVSIFQHNTGTWL